jgi:ankyrin repeat protein
MKDKKENLNPNINININSPTEENNNNNSIENIKKNLNKTKKNNINSIDILKGFLKEGEENNINQKNEIGWTPLYRSIITENINATEILLEKGADPDIQCSVKYKLKKYKIEIFNIFM